MTFPVQGGYVSMPVDLTPMQVTQWNLSYQRQFLGSMMFDVTYMGNQTTHIWSGYEENPTIYIPGNCVGRTVRADRRRARARTRRRRTGRRDRC